MRRIAMKPRADWRPGLRKYPFGVRSLGAGASWREKARYEFRAGQIDHIESVADEIHAMVLEACRYAVAGEHLPAFGYSRQATRLIEESWRSYWSGGAYDDRAGPLAGRLTFAFDGAETLKLLEAQYDGAVGLFAAAVIQRNWLETLAPGASQFNGLHEGLVERWAELAAATEGPAGELLHFTCLTPDAVREGELAYVAGAAEEAGLPAALLPIQNVGWDGRGFCDGEGLPIDWLYKLYPWQSMADEEFGGRIRLGAPTVVEPAWTALASNHGLLALLHHLYPSHPNLCRAGGDAAAAAGAERVAQRTFFGLEHAAQRVFDADGGEIWTNLDGAPDGRCVWLEQPHTFWDEEEGVSAVIDAWIVGGKCLGMAVREQEGPVVGPDAWIIPHLFAD